MTDLPDPELVRLRNTVEMLREAVENEGPVPEHHRAILARHRKEWPSLWRIIDLLLEAGGEQP